MTIQTSIVQSSASNVDDGPAVERLRHTLKVRSLTVHGVSRLTPGMIRIVFGGKDLADVVSLAADDHVKLIVPTGPGTTERRDYTPRRVDALARTLTIDFALHEAGPATRWALTARAGDTLDVAGPKGSAVIDADRWLLVGDETALPAIGRRIEEARAGTRIIAVVAVTGEGERQTFATIADLAMYWVYRPRTAAGDPAALLDTLRAIQFCPGTFVWIAAEAGVARALRKSIVEERGHPLGWIKAAGYWVEGRADAHEKIE